MNASQLKIIIVGGTSGVGLALAQAHLQQGWQVWVVGHNPQKINELRNNQPRIHILNYDLTNIAERKKLFNQMQEIDYCRLIYCAGWYLNERTSRLNKADSDTMLAINLQAFQEVFITASEHLKQRDHFIKQDQRTELITIASVAGLLDYPYSSLYAQSKQAMISTANAYRTALVPYGIDVLIIAPGYINTAMLRSLNQGDASHKPFIISEDKAINYILAAIEKRVPLTIFPRPMKYMIKGLSLLPKSVLGWLMLKKLDKPTIPANKSD